MRLTDDGAAMVAEMDYGHNPLAYLCSERPTDQPPTPHELCIKCADGFEAVTWKRRAVRIQTRLTALADELDGEVAADDALTVEDGQFAQGVAYAADRIRRAIEESA